MVANHFQFLMMKLPPSEALNRPLYRTGDDSLLLAFEEEASTRRLGFRIGNLGLLIAMQATSELSDVLQICHIPFTKTWLLGLINLRGNLVPVFDLHKLLQFPSVQTKKTMLLILGQGESAGAIVIDELPMHLNFIDSDKLTNDPPLPAIIKPFVSSGYEKEETVWFNFDNESFFKSLATQLAL
jgi:twitching motility protein PilI